MTEPGTELDFFSASLALGQYETLDVEGMKLLYKVEMSGDDFYQQLADRIDNEEAAVLLRRNGREETGHARRIARAIAAKTGQPFEPGPEWSGRFAIPLPDHVGPELFPLIVKAELEGDAGYQMWADAEPDPEVATLLRRNGREETRHSHRAQKAAALLAGDA